MITHSLWSLQEVVRMRRHSPICHDLWHMTLFSDLVCFKTNALRLHDIIAWGKSENGLGRVWHNSYPCHLITLPDTATREAVFSSVSIRGTHLAETPPFLGYVRWCPQILRICCHLQLSVSQSNFHNHLFHSRNHIFKSASAWPRLLRFVFTRLSAFFELLYPRTHIFHVHYASIAYLTKFVNFHGGIG
jgi:hypothetical protein